MRICSLSSLQQQEGERFGKSMKKIGVVFVQDTWAWSDSNLQWSGLGCELTNFPFLTAGSCPASSLHQPQPCVLCVIPVRLLRRETKDRFQDKIKTALEMHCVWQHLEQWWEVKKKSLTLTQESKLISENLMQHKVWRNKDCWGSHFVQLWQALFSTLKNTTV